MPALAPAQDGPGTWMGQHVLAVSRAVESRVRAGLLLLLCVCSQHRCQLPEGRGDSTSTLVCTVPSTESVLSNALLVDYEGSGVRRPPGAQRITEPAVRG